MSGILGRILSSVQEFMNRRWEIEIETQVKKLPDWSDLESRFKELGNAFRFTRLDNQTGPKTDNWRLAGVPAPLAKRQFEALATMAGNRLISDFPTLLASEPELQKEDDPIIRWYKALKVIGESIDRGYGTQQKNADGTSAGWTHTGSINNPAEASATFCLQLMARNRDN